MTWKSERRGRVVSGTSLVTTLVGMWILASSAQPLAAQATAIDETRVLRPDASVELRVVTHGLTVERWDRNEIRITGEYDSRWESVEIGGNEGSFRFEIRQEDRPGGQSRQGSDRISVRVPEGIHLTAWAVSGPVQLSGLTGTVSAHSVSGSVTAQGALEAVSLQSTSGSVRFEGSAPSVRLNTVSGGASLVGTAGEARLNSVSGRVLLEGGGEVVDARSVSGRVEVVSNTPVRSLDAGSVSGGIRFAGTLAPGGTLSAESHSGSVELALGSGTEARFELSTFSGRIDSAFPGARDEVRSGSRFSPNESLSFVTGSGAGRIEARSFSGGIRVRAGGE